MSSTDPQLIEVSNEIAEHELTEIINMNLTCRTCANQSDKLINIFNEDDVGNDLASKMNLYLPIKVSQTDDLPLQCCWSCASTILAWHDLVLTCVEAERRLRCYQLVISDKQLQDINYGAEKILNAQDSNLMVSAIPEGLDSFNPSQFSAEDLITCNIIEKIHKMENNLNGNSTKEFKLDCTQQTILEYPQNNFDVTEENDNSLLSPPMSIDCKEERPAADDQDISNDSEGDSRFKYACSYCPTLFLSEADIRTHLKEDHPDANMNGFLLEEPAMQTKVEIKSESDKEEMKQSDFKKSKEKTRRKHKIDQEKVNAAKVVVDGKIYYNCKECGKSLYSPYTYVWHMRIHTGERPYVCDLCGKQFRVSQGLVRHLKETHAQIKNFPCDICNRYFATRRNVEEHRRIHTNERPYVCDLCGKSFKQKASLFVHSRSHNNSFPFKCEHCPQAFRTKNLLSIHMTRHTGEKPYPCDICGRRFRIKYELKRHKLIHSDLKPFTCDICGLTFRQKRYLRNHMKLNHTRPSEVVSISVPVLVPAAVPVLLPANVSVSVSM